MGTVRPQHAAEDRRIRLATEADVDADKLGQRLRDEFLDAGGMIPLTYLMIAQGLARQRADGEPECGQDPVDYAATSGQGGASRFTFASATQARRVNRASPESSASTPSVAASQLSYRSRRAHKRPPKACPESSSLARNPSAQLRASRSP